MQKLIDWLSDEAQGVRQITGYILMAALVDVSLMYVLRAALINWGVVEDVYNPNPDSPFKYYNILGFVSALIQAPLFEETIFRFVPLTIITFFTKRPRTVFASVVLLAVLFGSIHPYSAIGCAKVAIAGLVFGIVFLKCGGLSGHTIKAWGCAIATHSMSNAFLLAFEYYDYLEHVL